MTDRLQTTRRPAAPRWRKTRFGNNLDLMLRSKWLGSVEPEIAGRCRYSISGRDGGTAPTQADAKAIVERACIHA